MLTLDGKWCIRDYKNAVSYYFNFCINLGESSGDLSTALRQHKVDIEINPGPSPSVYHCGFCQLPVDWSDVAVACDECSIWYHKSCLEMSTSKFQNLNCSNVSWICMKCCTMNTEPHLFNSFEIILENSFAPLDDNVISNTIDSIDSLFSPTYASSPQFTH